MTLYFESDFPDDLVYVINAGFIMKRAISRLDKSELGKVFPLKQFC